MHEFSRYLQFYFKTLFNLFKTLTGFQDTYDFKIHVSVFKTPKMIYQEAYLFFKTHAFCIKTLDYFQDTYDFKTHVLCFQDTSINFQDMYS